MFKYITLLFFAFSLQGHGVETAPTEAESRSYLDQIIQEAKAVASKEGHEVEFSKMLRQHFDLKYMVGQVLREVVRDLLINNNRDRAKVASIIDPFTDRFINKFSDYILKVYSTPEKIKIFKNSQHSYKSYESPAGSNMAVVTYNFKMGSDQGGDTPVKFYLSKTGKDIKIKDVDLDAFNFVKNEAEVVSSLYKNNNKDLEKLLSLYGK
jgi:hypothetical protein